MTIRATRLQNSFSNLFWMHDRILSGTYRFVENGGGLDQNIQQERARFDARSYGDPSVSGARIGIRFSLYGLELTRTTRIKCHPRSIANKQT